ncbi:cation-translocating P-type ATPase [Halomonas sp. EGI 63088]|uniref:Cation-translocating P-type ATPase n=1 Tax=Halomonas flagellata TaxID=2920385 RepID=A0ABS9RVE7_9GAMM|nr:cation-translocating P-type ATPase [Halomonas flagellata]MCH4563806.1 cation-translocating P-type ATPase [Halomonas flagellata]
MPSIATPRAAPCSDVVASSDEALYSLEGLWCSGCALAIEHRLGRLPGVRRVGIDYASATLWVAGAPEAIGVERLAPPVARLGYRLRALESVQDAEARLDAESRRLTGRLLVAALFGMWSLLASLLIYAGALPEPRLERVLALVSGAFAVPVVLHAGVPFYVAAWRTLRAGRPGMDALVSLGVAAALAVSLWLLWRGSAEVYFDTAVMLILLLLAGRWIETLARYRSLRALEGLAPTPVEVTVLRESGTARVPLEAVAIGERLQVAAGEQVPLDGVLLDAGARLDLSPLTGESRPQRLTRGDRVMAGGRNRGDALTLAVTARAGECRMDRLYRDMRRHQAAKGQRRVLAERFAAWLSPLALGLSLATLGALLAAGMPAEEALVRSLAVLVVACPCAVGLALPLASLAGSARGLERGVVFRDPAALELAGRLQAVAFDKTGTLTLGELTVTALHPAPGGTEVALLRLAARLEWGSEHPAGRAIRHRALERGVLPDEAPWRVEERAGRGRIAWLAPPRPGEGEERTLRIGSPAWLAELGISPPADMADDPACTRVDLARGRHWLGSLWLADAPDPSAAPLLASLRDEGVLLALVSGDRPCLVRRLGAELGLAASACFAGRSPEQKRALVAALPRPSLHVGDGINDAPALAAVSVGVAPLGASTAARDAAAILLLRPGPGGVREAIDIARATRRVMGQNLLLSVLYNALALGLAAWMVIPPQVAVLAMALSSLSVVANAARLGWAGAGRCVEGEHLAGGGRSAL